MEISQLIARNEFRVFNGVIQGNYPDCVREYVDLLRNSLLLLNPDSRLNQEFLKRTNNDLNSIYNYINEVLRLYYSGYIFESTKIFFEFMDWLDKFWFSYKTSEYLADFPGVFGASPNFYRARLFDKYTIPESNQLFHIPFELRNYSATGRFNLPGMPCLYLGRSIHACWEELNKPNYENIYVSKFILRDRENVKIVNFSEPMQVTYKHLQFSLMAIIVSTLRHVSIFNVSLNERKDLEKIKNICDNKLVFDDNNNLPEESIMNWYVEIEKDNYEIVDILINNGFSLSRLFDIFYFDFDDILNLFNGIDYDIKKNLSEWRSLLQTALSIFMYSVIMTPLKNICSARVEDYGMPFKPEYIIPQLVMQWVFMKNNNSKELYGISYLSSKTPLLNTVYSKDVNMYRNYAFPSVPMSNGYCEKLMKYFSITDPISINQINTNHNFNKDTLNKKALIYNHGFSGYEYKNTYLYNLEQYLENSSMHGLSTR